MKPTNPLAAPCALPSELLPSLRTSIRHTAPRRRRRLDLWATGGTLVIGLALLLVASLFSTPQTRATNEASESVDEPRDLALVDEFIVTEEDETIPAPPNDNVRLISTHGPAPGDRLNSVSPAQISATSSPSSEEEAEAPPTTAAAETAAPSHADPEVVAPDIAERAASLPHEVARLSKLPPASLRFDHEPLEIAVSLIADSAGMSYATNGVLQGEVTGSLEGNPYQLLKNLSKAYHFDMDYDNGLWTFASSLKNQATSIRKPVITKTYPITNNMMERLTMKTTSQVGGGGLGSGRGASGSGAFGSGGSSGGSSRMASANLLAGQTVFDANYNRMIDDLQQLLQANNQGREAYQASVFLNEDSNSLLAVGTEEDHRLIKAYIDNFDRPQRALALEVKLVRTKRNPSSLVGVDWSNGIAVDLSGNFDEGKFTLDQVMGGLGGNPTGVLLTNSEANITLDAIKNDSLTKRISYIEKMTLDNREVVLSNVVEEPVIADREEVDSESGLRVLLSIEKEIIGTVINILPRIMRDESIKMRLRIEDSNIVRFKQFFEDASGGEYPVISKQTYEGPVSIKNGYSLAITGFETTEEVHTSSRVPVLGDIPLVGKAFGRDRTQEERSYLVIFITPRILEDTSTGVDYLKRGHHLGRSEPVGPIAGTHFDDFRDLEQYVSGIRRQHDELMQEADIRGVTAETIAEASFLYSELEALANHLQSFSNQGVEPNKTNAMLDFCETGIINTWRILQQDIPPLANSPAEVVQNDRLGSNSTYTSAKHRALRQQQASTPRKRSFFRNLFGGRRHR